MILEHKSIISAGYSCVLHIHSCVEEVTLKVGLMAILFKRETILFNREKVEMFGLFVLFYFAKWC